MIIIIIAMLRMVMERKKKRKKKKKKKGKKKGGGGGGGDGNNSGASLGELAMRGIKGELGDYRRYGQTHPPSIPIAKLPKFANGNFPEGEILEHPGYSEYMTSEERRANDRMNSDLVQTVREASEIHRQVRRYAQSFIKPGIKLTPC